MKWTTLFLRQLQREYFLNIRTVQHFLNGSVFFLMLLVFFPLTLKANTNILKDIMPGMVWISVSIACLLSSDRMFDDDFDNGILEQWLLSGYPLSIMIVARILIRILMNFIPLLFICPMIALFYGLTFCEGIILIFSVFCAMPAMVSLCALAAVFGTGLSQRGAYMGLIILPLILPVLIFGSSTLMMHLQGHAVGGLLALLTAFSMLALTFLPIAIAGVIRNIAIS